MAEALPYVETPSVLPKGITKRQWRLAALLPRCQTAAEAMRQAGYALSTVDKNSRHQLGTVGTQRATLAIEEARRDKAREIKLKAGARVNRELDKADSDAGYALNAWATASKIAAEYPDEEQGVGEYDRQSAQAYIRAVVRAVLDATRQDVCIMVTDDLIDSIAVSVSASDNGQYVNSQAASPPGDSVPLQLEGKVAETATIETTATRTRTKKRKA